MLGLRFQRAMERNPLFERISAAWRTDSVGREEESGRRKRMLK